MTLTLLKIKKGKSVCERMFVDNT